MILNDNRVKNILPSLWLKTSQIEGEIELEYSKHRCEEPVVTIESLLSYHYAGDYDQLVSMELNLLFDSCSWLSASSMENPLHFMMIGSGSFPMTAILIHLKTGSFVTCVDIDPRAVEVSRRLISKLGLSDRIDVVLSRAEDLEFNGNEIIWIASLVQGKDEIINKVSKVLVNGVVVVRSADGLFCLLYEPIDRSNVVDTGLFEVGHTHSNDITVNSTFYYANHE